MHDKRASIYARCGCIGGVHVCAYRAHVHVHTRACAHAHICTPVCIPRCTTCCPRACGSGGAQRSTGPHRLDWVGDRSACHSPSSCAGTILHTGTIPSTRPAPLAAATVPSYPRRTLRRHGGAYGGSSAAARTCSCRTRKSGRRGTTARRATRHRQPYSQPSRAPLSRALTRLE